MFSAHVRAASAVNTQRRRRKGLGLRSKRRWNDPAAAEEKKGADGPRFWDRRGRVGREPINEILRNDMNLTV